MFAPKRSNLALGLGVNQIELLQRVIYSKHVNWLKVWNFHLSQIIEHSTSSLSSGAVACGEAIKNGRKIIASQTQRACHAAAGYRRRDF